jgi:amino acid transporter
LALLAAMTVSAAESCATLARLFRDSPDCRLQIREKSEPPLKETSSGLVRTIGRWSLVALIINTMIGASIFGLPALIAARLGGLSPVGFFMAFAGISLIAACMAEVASQFKEAGGPYLYAKAAFGRFLAIQNGWLTWLTRVAAVSAVANLFITYLSEFFPRVKSPLPRAAVLTMLIGFLAAVNYRGVTEGNWVSNFFTVTKVSLLTFFIVAGLVALALHPKHANHTRHDATDGRRLVRSRAAHDLFLWRIRSGAHRIWRNPRRA